MIGVIVLKQFQRFVKVKNGIPFKNSLFFYFMLIHHLNNVKHGVTIQEHGFHALKLNYWLIWFINQRALYNHELSVMRHPASLASASASVHTPLGTGLDIETSYLVHICTYAPHICTSNI